MLRKLAAVTVAAVLVLAFHASAQWGPGGGGGRRGGGWGGGGDHGRFEKMRGRGEAMRALNLEGMWAVLNFGMDVPAAELDSLRAPFKDIWSKRASVLATTGDDTDWDAIKDEFTALRKDLEGRMKPILSDDQRKAFDREMKTYGANSSPFAGEAP